MSSPPTVYFVDRHGNLVGRVVGPHEWDSPAAGPVRPAFEDSIEDRSRIASQLVDERGGGGEQRFEAVLDRAVGDGQRLARAAPPAEDQAGPLSDELGTEEAAEERQADAQLEGEVVLVDGLEERKVGALDAALNAGLRPMGNFLGHQEGQEVPVADRFLFGPGHQFWIQPAHGGQVQPAEKRVDVDRGRRATD